MFARNTPASTRPAIFARAIAARNLSLLRSIETTLRMLDQDIKQIHLISEGFERAHEYLRSINTSNRLDESGEASAALEEAMETASRMYAHAAARHESACLDTRLRPDDGVADSLSDYLNALADLHAVISTLHDWVGDHDAALDAATGETFDNAEDLFLAIGVNVQ